MPRTSKSKARNKKVHTEIEPAAPFQALLKPHETCDLLVPSKESPISLPTPLLLLYEFHWFLCHKGEEKGLSVYQAHTYFFFSPTLKLFFFLSRNPMQLKCLYLPLFFLYHPKQEDFHSLFSFREERNSKAAQCTLLEMERWKGVALNEPGAEELCGDHFKHKFSYVWLSSCDRIKPCLSHPQFQPHSLLWGTQGCSLKVFVKLQLDDPHGVWHYTGAWLSYIVQSCCNQERKDRGKGHCNQVIAFRCYHFIVSSRGAAAELIRAQMRMKAWSPLSVLVLLHFFCCFYKVTE